jgi:hypothetical protein
MNCFRLFAVAALVLTAVLGGSSLLDAAKGPKRPAPKVQHHPARPAPRPKPPAKKKPAPRPTPKKAAPRPKAPVPSKVKPVVHRPKAAKTAKEPRKAPRRIEHVHRFAHFNERTREFRFDARWWYRFVVYPGTVSPADAFEADYSAEDPPPTPPEVNVTPPVIQPGQGFPISRGGSSLTALLDGMDVEHHWLPGQRVGWKTGNPIADDSGPASNGGAFVAAVCARLKVPMPAPAPENFLPGSQYDWLVTKGKAKGWVAVAAVEAQLLANQGWVVIAAWKDMGPVGERTIAGLTAVVRPDALPAADIPTRGPRIIGAGAVNRNSIALNDGFPARAWQKNEVVYLAHRPR